jgi:hypothetical protein
MPTGEDCRSDDMRVGIEVTVESRGIAARRPLVLPVFFASSDASLRAVLGDVGAAEFVFPAVPASYNEKEPISWVADVPVAGISEENALVGVGLLYIDGSAEDPAVAAAQGVLANWLESAMLAHVAMAFGLTPLLTAFGAKDSNDQIGGDRLRQLLAGVDPLESADLVDPGLSTGFRAFAPFREVLVGGRRSRGRAALKETAELPDATIVAATAQAWPLADLVIDRPIGVQRRLKARTPRTSLTFQCTVTREG